MKHLKRETLNTLEKILNIHFIKYAASMHIINDITP